MTTYKASVFMPGALLVPCYRCPSPIQEPKARSSRLDGESPEEAGQRIQDASVRVKEDLLARAENAGRDGKAVLKSTSQMATDRALIKSAVKLVETQQMAPERAIWEAATSFADQMAALGGYMAERVTDSPRRACPHRC